jgi:hypothetical protein
MYKLVKSLILERVNVVNKQIGNVLHSIPFDPANTDYQTFKKEVLAGEELQDSDGNLMTPEAAKEYLATLS